MGAANSVCKLTIDSIALLEQLEPNAAEIAHKSAIRRRVEKLLAKEWPLCRVLPFGSSESGFGFGGCDLDLGIYFDDIDLESQGHFTPQEKIDILSAACERLQGDFEVREFVRHARVPILKLWDPKRQVSCDLCVGGVHALLNTALLKYYGQADPRVRPLVFAVKYWAKQRGINDSANGTLSSYGFSLLLIFYLQSQHLEIRLPAVDSLFRNLMTATSISLLVERLNELPFMETIPSTFGTSEVNSVGALLAGFFEFYSQRFNMEDDVVSVRTGAVLSKTTKWSHPVSWRISIEDPFELAHDVGRVVFHKAGQELLEHEFARAFDMIHSGQRWEDICQHDETAWDSSVTCYICRGSDHTTRNCSQLSRHRMSSKTASASGGFGLDPNALAFLTDCWYCGEHGHYKANCPMLFFRDIPLPSALPPELAGSPTDVGAFMASAMKKPAYRHKQQQQQQQQRSLVMPNPIVNPKTMMPKLSPARNRSELAVWERGASVPTLSSPSNPPSRPTKRKKRSRHGSASSCSTPFLPPSLSATSMSWLPPDMKHQQRNDCRQEQPQQSIQTLPGQLSWNDSSSRGGGKKCAVAMETEAVAQRACGVDKILCQT